MTQPNGNREAGRNEAMFAEIMRRLGEIDRKQDEGLRAQNESNTVLARHADEVARLRGDVEEWDDHTHADLAGAVHAHDALAADIESLKRRDWMALILAAVAALGTLATVAWKEPSALGTATQEFSRSLSNLLR